MSERIFLALVNSSLLASIFSTVTAVPSANAPSSASMVVSLSVSEYEQGITSLVVSPQRRHLPSLSPVELMVGSFTIVGFSKSCPSGSVLRVSSAPQVAQTRFWVPPSVQVAALLSLHSPNLCPVGLMAEVAVCLQRVQVPVSTPASVQVGRFVTVGFEKL